MISHRHKTVFVHIPKTGGQSVELAFLAEHGLAWRDRAPLLLRANDDRALGPARLAHLYAHEYVSKGHLSADDFDAYFKFAVVRDPYSRIVSSFNFRDHSFTSIRDFVEAAPNDDHDSHRRQVTPQVTYLFDATRTRFVVDRVLRFETLAQDMQDVFRRVFGGDRPLPHRNAAVEKRLTVERLTRDDIAFVNETYAEDFLRLGYEIKPI